MQAASRLAVILGESSTQGQEIMADSLRLSTQPFASASATGGSGPAQTAVLSDSLRPRYPRLDPAFEQWPAGGFVQGMLNVVSVEQAPAVEEEPEAPPADAIASLKRSSNSSLSTLMGSSSTSLMLNHCAFVLKPHSSP